MKILFDFLTLHSKNGAAEYTRRVFYALLNRLDKDAAKDNSIYCLYDSKAEPAYHDLRCDVFIHDKVYFIDIQKGASFINEQGFDVFFFGCAQNGGWHPELSEFNIKSIIVFHDCVWEDLYNNDISIYQVLNSEEIFRYRADRPQGKHVYLDIKGPTIRFCRWLLYSREHGLLEKGHDMVLPSLSLFRKRKDNSIVTVSNYSRGSIMYNFGITEDEISVMYSPERLYMTELSGIDISGNAELDRLVKKGIKYYLIVSANRGNKNAKKALMAFRKFSCVCKDSYVVTVGYGRVLFENHVDLPFLSDTDLQKAYKYCYALLYPSLFEGFGYPPLEAMKYGKPVLSSNVCSMPEILGDAPIYFCPFYESAIFKALMALGNENYEECSIKSARRYREVSERQERDLSDLIDMILTTSK